MTAVAQTVARKGQWQGPADLCVLNYDGRFLRRKVLHTDDGEAFLVDLPKTMSVDDGDAFALSDGRFIAVRSAAEELMEVTGPDLARLAWHIGNRHAPCQVARGRLLVQRDHVMRQMLEGLGAHVRDVVEAFTPERGAYGHGRTHGHAH